MNRILFLIVPLLLGGCAATGAPFVAEKEPAPDKANLYIYRPELATHCCVAPHILINNEKRGQLKNGGYFVFPVSAGPVTVEAVNETVGFKSLKLTIEAQPGTSYYLRWSAAASMGFQSYDEKKSISSGNAQIYASEETKKRTQEAAEGKLANVQRASDYTNNNMMTSVLLNVAHERELRVVEKAHALKEIALTRKSE